MRACYLENLADFNESIIISTKSMHHLVNVIRIKEGDEIKFFDKNKNIAHVKSSSITKKEMVFEIIEKNKADSSEVLLEVAVGKLKKDAMDLAIKQLVEIGISKITIFESTFSQAYPVKLDRLEKIIISAMEQSNNFNFPEVRLVKFTELLKSDKNKIYFSSVASNHQKIDTLIEDSLVIIGPEGGMSESEEEILTKSATVVSLPTFILRASTAVSFCTGYITGKM
jgi:16S rRNA (uracil1498-N3)-methyltransferase